jgi:replication factor A2
MATTFSEFGGYDGGGQTYDQGHGQGFLQGASSQAEERGGRTENKSPLIPLTIRQLMNSQGEKDSSSLLIENKSFSKVIVLGKVMAMKNKETANTYTLDDGTGQIEVTVWFDSDESPHAQVGCWVAAAPD